MPERKGRLFLVKRPAPLRLDNRPLATALKTYHFSEDKRPTARIEHGQFMLEIDPILGRRLQAWLERFNSWAQEEQDHLGV